MKFRSLGAEEKTWIKSATKKTNKQHLFLRQPPIIDLDCRENMQGSSLEQMMINSHFKLLIGISRLKLMEHEDGTRKSYLCSS